MSDDRSSVTFAGLAAVVKCMIKDYKTVTDMAVIRAVRLDPESLTTAMKIRNTWSVFNRSLIALDAVSGPVQLYQLRDELKDIIRVEFSRVAALIETLTVLYGATFNDGVVRELSDLIGLGLADLNSTANSAASELDKRLIKWQAFFNNVGFRANSVIVDNYLVAFDKLCAANFEACLPESDALLTSASDNMDALVSQGPAPASITYASASNARYLSQNTVTVYSDDATKFASAANPPAAVTTSGYAPGTRSVVVKTFASGANTAESSQDLLTWNTAGAMKFEVRIATMLFGKNLTTAYVASDMMFAGADSTCLKDGATVLKWFVIRTNSVDYPLFYTKVDGGFVCAESPAIPIKANTVVKLVWKMTPQDGTAARVDAGSSANGFLAHVNLIGWSSQMTLNALIDVIGQGSYSKGLVLNARWQEILDIAKAYDDFIKTKNVTNAVTPVSLSTVFVAKLVALGFADVNSNCIFEIDFWTQSVLSTNRVAFQNVYRSLITQLIKLKPVMASDSLFLEYLG